MGKRLSNNWAEGIKKPFTKTKEVPTEIVWFMVFGKGLPARIGIMPKNVEQKTKEWDEKQIVWKKAQ